MKAELGGESVKGGMARRFCATKTGLAVPRFHNYQLFHEVRMEKREGLDLLHVARRSTEG